MSSYTAIQIAGRLTSHGHQAWLVGGCVRDMLLGRDPQDYDISTDATPDRLLELFPGADLVGAQFGVVLVDGVEVATFRSDLDYRDGRHPEAVRFETDPHKRAHGPASTRTKSPVCGPEACWRSDATSWLIHSIGASSLRM